MESNFKKISILEYGQSTIEFLFTFISAIGFTFLFLKMALNYTDGYMVHHATFMASRAYLSFDNNRQDIDQGDVDAFSKAKEVFKKYLPEGLVSAADPNALSENRPGKVGIHAFIGVWIEYVQAFSIGPIGGKEPVVFRSESFLGRQPTRQETLMQTCEAIKRVTKAPIERCDVHATLEDNGG